MICRKCKTAVEENSKECANCGAKLGNNKFWLIASVCIVAILFAAYFVYNNGNDREELPNGPDIAAEDPQNPAPEPSENPEVKEEPASLPEVNTDKEKLPESEADLDMPIDEVWAMIDDMVIYANEYYKRYVDTVTFISKNGYLYDFPAKSYVFSKDFKGLTSMDDKYEDANVLFFFIRPADLKGFGDLYVSDSKELKIFAAYETKDGFAVSADGESGGIISRQDIKKVMDKYIWERGDVFIIDPNSSDYESVINAVHNHVGSTEAYDVRFLRYDGKYVSIIVSPKGQSEDMRQYVLENTGDIFKVIADGIEKETDDKMYVNNILPDFNLAMLPSFNLSVSFKYLKSGFDNVVDIMQNNGLITADDLPVVFESGTNEFMYLEFSSGKKYVGYFEANTWQMCAIEDYYEAYWLMENMTKWPPFYILKQY